MHYVKRRNITSKNRMYLRLLQTSAMMLNMELRIVIGILSLVHHGSSYMIGAPLSVCLGHHVVHDKFKEQTSESPFKLQLSSYVYTPGQEINVTLASPDKRSFKGFLILAHRTTGDLERPVGHVMNFPADKAQAIGCVYDKRVGITHKNNDTITSLQYTWKAPLNNEGDLIFRYIVVADHDTFWIYQKSEILRAWTPLIVVPKVEQENHDISGINWEECGVSKGCFLYPRTCSGSDCTAAVTFRPLPDDMFEFEMYVRRNEYISVGFSPDKIMTEDHVHACTGGNEKLSVQNGYNPLYYYMRVYRDGIRNMSVWAVNGDTFCRFVRPRSMVVFNEYSGNVSFHLNNTYYLMMAWGHLYYNTDALGHHIELPVISENLVNFYDMTIIRGSSLPVPVQVHGILMLIAWFLFVGITTIISRYYKGLGGDNKVFGTKYWFQIHRACAVLAWMLTAASFIIIFVHVGGLSKNAELHSYFGIAVMAACTLQVLAGLLRPGLDSKIRPAFNVLHWFCGKCCHLLAAIAFFLAFYADIISSKQSEFGIITTGVWVGVQILWEIAFEIRKALCSAEKRPTSSDTKQQKTMRLDTILLILYMVCMLALLAAGIASILLF